MDRNLLSMCAVPGRVIFCSSRSSMSLAPRIFPKFWSIRSLISPSTPTTRGTVSDLITIFLLLLLFYFILFLFHTELVEEFWTSGKFVRLSVPCTPFTDETSNRLGLCDMYYVFYRLLSTTHFQKLVYLLRINATKS